MFIFYALSALFTLLAWLIADGYPPWVTVYQETSMIFGLLFLFLAMVSKPIKVPKISIAWIALIFVPIVQYLLNIVYYRQDALVSSSYLFLFWLAFILGFNSINSNKKNVLDNTFIFSTQINPVIQGFLMIIVMAALINVFIALAQWLMLESSIWTLGIKVGGRPYGNFGQPNHLATMVSMGLIALLIQYENNFINKYLAVFIGSILLFGSVITQSRTAWLFSIFLIICWLVKGKNLNLKFRINNLLVWVSIYSLLLLTIPYITRFLGLSGYEQYGNRITAGFERLSMWQQVLYAISKEPIFGYGWGQIRAGLMETVYGFPNPRNFESSHNLLLDLIIWNGLPIGIAIDALIVMCLWKIYRSRLSKNTFMFLVLGLPIFIHSLLEYPLYYAFFLIPFGFILGLAYSYSDKDLHFIEIPKYISIMGTIIFLIILVVFVVEYISMFQKTQQVRYESAGLTNKIVYLKNNELNIFTDKFEDYIWFYRLDLSKELTEKDLEKIERLYKANPDFPVIAKYIHAQYKIGNIEKAKEAEHVIKIFYPKKFASVKTNSISMNSD